MVGPGGGIENTLPDECFEPHNLNSTTLSIAILLFLQAKKKDADWPDVEDDLGAHRWLAEDFGEYVDDAETRVKAAVRRIRARVGEGS